MMELLSDKELAQLWHREYPQVYGCQATFSKEYKINRGNFGSWLRGLRGSPVSRQAVILYLNQKDAASSSSSSSLSSSSIHQSYTSAGVKHEAEDDHYEDGREGSAILAGKHIDSVTTSLSSMKIKEKPRCKYFLKGVCTQGVNCAFSHSDPNAEATEKYVTHVKGIREDLCTMKDLRVLMFVDYDNCPWRNRNFNTSSEYDGWIALTFMSPLCTSPLPLLGPRVILIKSLTAAKNAVDHTISMEAALLDFMLQDKRIEFVFVTKDWFSVEVVERIKAFGRACSTSDMGPET